MRNNYVDEYGTLIAKRMLRDGRSHKEVQGWLQSRYGRVSVGFVHRLQRELEEGNGRAR